MDNVTIKLTNRQYELVVSLVETRAIQLCDLTHPALRNKSETLVNELKEVDDLLLVLDEAV